jgi:hypothetical protein
MMTAEQYDAYIEATVANMPPLRPEQITRLAVLFDYERGERVK